MNEYQPQILAQGTLGTSSTGDDPLLFLGIAGCVVQSVRFFNTNASTRTVTIVLGAVVSGGTFDIVHKLDLAQDESAVIHSIPIGVADKVGAYASGSGVNFFVLGARR